MRGRVPPTERFGRQNQEAEKRNRDIRDALRIDGAQYNVPNLIAAAVHPVAVYRLDSPAVSSASDEYAQISTPVPAGYTRALVNLVAMTTLRSNEPTDSWALLTVSAGVQGLAHNTGWFSISGQMYGTATSSCAEVVEGLTEGDTVDVSAFTAFPGAYTLPRVSVAGSILFLR